MCACVGTYSGGHVLDECGKSATSDNVSKAKPNRQEREKIAIQRLVWIIAQVTFASIIFFGSDDGSGGDGGVGGKKCLYYLECDLHKLPISRRIMCSRYRKMG